MTRFDENDVPLDQESPWDVDLGPVVPIGPLQDHTGRQGSVGVGEVGRLPSEKLVAFFSLQGARI